MSTPANDEPEPDAQPATRAADADAEPSADADELDALPGQARRGISEWAVVLALVALIVAVAWSQFGSLFDASTEGSGPAAQPGVGVEVEAEGVTLGGSAMSTLGPDGPSATASDDQPAHDDEDNQADPEATGPRGASDE